MSGKLWWRFVRTFPNLIPRRRFVSSFFTAQNAKTHLLSVSEEVKAALAEKRGIVALESTVITHGLPFPTNLETSLSMEEIIRNEGCVPATIGILGGKICIGLTKSEIEQFSECKDAVKVSRRDLATTLASKKIGGTTVAGTMLAAKMAGIRIFATGGIGGVHRGVGHTMDISADLEELGKTRIAVVCAGVKSILDIGNTLEYLETKGVCVTTFGSDKSFPGFFSRKSGFESRYSTEKVDEIAQSLNVALLKNNAQAAAKIAISYASANQRHASTSTATIYSHDNRKNSIDRDHKPKIIVIGGTNVDLTVSSNQEVKLDGSTCKGRMEQDCGGVAKVHADALTRLGNSVKFVSTVGDDLGSRFIKDRCKHMDLSRVHSIPGEKTATYVAFTSGLELMFGVIQSEVHDKITPDMVKNYEKEISEAHIAVLDSNLSIETLAAACMICNQHKVPIWLEPTTTEKAEKIFLAESWNKVFAVSPNWAEFLRFLKCLNLPTNFANEDELLWPLESHSGFAAVIKSVFWNKNLHYLVLTRGSKGTLLFSKESDGVIKCSQVPIPKLDRLVSVSGAGDNFNSGFIHGYLRSWPLWKCIAMANECAGMSLSEPGLVSQRISDISEIGLKNINVKEFYL